MPTSVALNNRCELTRNGVGASRLTPTIEILAISEVHCHFEADAQIFVCWFSPHNALTFLF